MRPCYTISQVASLLTIVCFLDLGGCALLGGSKTSSLVGTWDYTMVDASGQTMTGVMTLREAEEGRFTGHLTVLEVNIDNEMIVESLVLEKKILTLDASVDGTAFSVVATLNGDALVGENDVTGVGFFTFTATRRRD